MEYISHITSKGRVHFAVGAGGSRAGRNAPFFVPLWGRPLAWTASSAKVHLDKKRELFLISSSDFSLWPDAGPEAFAPMHKICFWHCYRVEGERSISQMSKCFFSTKPVISPAIGPGGSFYFLRWITGLQGFLPSNISLHFLLCGLPTQMIEFAQMFYFLCCAFVHGSLSPHLTFLYSRD